MHYGQIFVVLLCWVFGFTNQAFCAGTTYAILNSKVLSMKKNRAVKTPVILIVDDKIEAMGSNQDVSIPQSAFVIDATGKFVMPGLVDMHSHLTNQDELILNVANGITSVRVMWGNPDILNWKKKILAGQLVGPVIYSSGAIIDGHPVVHEGSASPGNVNEAENEVRKQKQEGYDFIKVYNNLDLNIYNAIVRTAKQINIPVVGHVPTSVGIKKVWSSGQKTIEHWQGLLAFLKKDNNGEVDESKIGSYIEQTVESEIWNCPTAVVLNRAFFASVLQQEQWLKAPEIRYIDPELRAMWTNFVEERRKTNLPLGKDLALLKKETPRLIKHLYENGAKLLIGTDTPNPLVFPGFSIHEELRHFKDAGLSPYQVLKIATADAAKALGREHDLGAIEVGKLANLLIVDKDPRVNLAHLKDRLHGTMVLGRWLSSSFLDESLEAIAKKYEDSEQLLETKSIKNSGAFGNIHSHL